MIALRILSSSRLALLLVLFLIILSAVGVMVPQEGMYEPGDINRWQQDHALVTSLLAPLGLFRVFYSYPFLICILLLAINTFTCTVVRISRMGGASALKGPDGIRTTGFVILHLSLLILFAGGLWSSAMRMKGYVVLTEGQDFKNEHEGYLKIVEGPLRKESHEEFIVRLNRVETKYERLWFPVDIASALEIRKDQEKLIEGTVKVNRPLDFQGMTYTLDQIGFSPRVVIQEKDSERLLVNHFIALKTFRSDQGRVYRDFLPLPFFEDRIILTVLPDHSLQEGRPRKTGEEPGNPLLIVEMEDDSGELISHGFARLGERIELGEYTVGFAELRRWSSFLVVQDPGRFLIWFSLWLGVAALLLRYIPDLKVWLGKQARRDSSSKEQGGSI